MNTAVERRERQVEPGPDLKTPPSPCWLLYMPCACSQMDDVVIEEKGSGAQVPVLVRLARRDRWTDGKMEQAERCVESRHVSLLETTRP